MRLFNGAGVVFYQASLRNQARIGDHEFNKLWPRRFCRYIYKMRRTQHFVYAYNFWLQIQHRNHSHQRWMDATPSDQNKWIWFPKISTSV